MSAAIDFDVECESCGTHLSADVDQRYGDVTIKVTPCECQYQNGYQEAKDEYDTGEG